MDLIDIILARAKSFTGETTTLVRQAQAAMADANDIVDRLEGIENRASTAAETAEGAAEALAGIDETVDAEIKKLSLSIDSHGMANGGGVTYDLITTYPDNTTATVNDIVRMYNSRGGHVNGTMTQEAINYELGLIEESLGNFTVNVIDNNTSAAKIKQLSVTKNGQTTTYNVEKNYTSSGDNEDGSMTQKAIKTYIQNAIAAIPSGGGNSGDSTIINFGIDKAGRIVMVNTDGTLTTTTLTIDTLVEALIKLGAYQTAEAVSIEIDYANKTVARAQESAAYSAGSNFNSYAMYGGRMRCNVSDNGQITAFYGDSNYREDGSNGQVMVYQPKFYYRRIMTEVSNQAIQKEAILISPIAQSGFKLHPLFINDQGEEVDYVLLSAYEGCAYDVSESTYNTTDASGVDFDNDKLSSIANAKPISGANNSLTISNAAKLAENRGAGWKISTLESESAMQLLEIVEFGSLNGQLALEKGICNITNIVNKNCASQTGSTSSLGNTTGAAASTVNITNGVSNTYSDNGRRAISYRGVENPWGNIWKMIGNVRVRGDGTQQGGIVYIGSDNLGFTLPGSYSWISNFGYEKPEYDWTFIPKICGNNANSVAPVGDYLWTHNGLNGANILAIGGSASSTDNGGPFYFACDYADTFYGSNYGARLLYVPAKNSIYNSNITAWTNKMGG